MLGAEDLPGDDEMSETVRGERHPYNGKPFYCKVCGLGFSEFMACENVDCKLEDEATAISRAEKEKTK